MRVWRPLSVLGWLLVSTLIVVPILAVPLGAVVDRSPDGSGRFSAFPLALAISDVSVREAIRNSVGLASGVSLGAMIVGVGFARVATGRRFRGLAALATLARVSGSVPPLFGAIGLAGLGWFDGDNASRWRWAALVWVEMAWAVPRVMAAAMSCFDRVSPSWEDGARMAGVSRSRAWWVSSWPAARPRVARAVATVFAVVLIEPSAPLVLGVRRSLGYLLIENWLVGDRTTRVAALGAIALVITIAARTLIVWRGGPNWPLAPASWEWRRASASWTRCMLASGALLIGSACLLGPLVLMIATATGWGTSDWHAFARFSAMILQPQTRAFLADSAILGLSATAVASLMAWLLSRREPGLTWRSPSRWPSRISPVLFGLGGAMFPGLLDEIASSIAARSPGISGGLHGLANAIDPFFSPWILLVVVVAILGLPELSRAIDEVRREDDRVAIDTARTLGASPSIALWTIRVPRVARVWGGPLARRFASAALDAGPALLLCPTLACRPVAPGMISLISGPEGLQRAATLATIAMTAPLVAWIVAGIHREDGGRPV